MTSSVLELERVIVHALSENAAVMEILGGVPRIFTDHGKESEEATRVMPTLIIEHTGGPRQRSAPIARRGFYLYAYANRSQADALRLYEAAASVLQTEGKRAPPEPVTGDPVFDLRGYFVEVDGPRSDYNTQVTAWYVRGTWTGHTFG